MFQKRSIGAIAKRRAISSESSTIESEPQDVEITRASLSKRRALSAKSKNQNACSRGTAEGYKLDRFESAEMDNQRATSTFEIDTESSRDNRSILERNVEIGQKLLNKELPDGIYRGRGAYKPIVKKDAIAASKYTGLYGPVRASATNVRTTLRIDYQPDVCKDYKETGYCGFGDTCKFLHDRSDYKSGWQIEKEWQQQQQRRQEKTQAKIDAWHRKMQANLETGEPDGQGKGDEPDPGDPSDPDESDTSDSDATSPSDPESAEGRLRALSRELGVPFCCLSCRAPWSMELDPVVTSCGHYFCFGCATAAFSRNMKCAKCSKPQDGILNKAATIIKLLKMLN
ncbi:bifunctional Zinc finger [Babesia duncani]|uniref:Bifunctional Zinc finger n=1 Tax=Babesia duncani TaxID=323732 RepID=A0AAD9PKZ6_9APIC|nr:bifunctional Zinc finger [Babesia duncani]